MRFNRKQRLADQLYDIGAPNNLCRLVDVIEKEVWAHGLTADAVDLRMDVAGPGTMTVVMAMTFPMYVDQYAKYGPPHRLNDSQVELMKLHYGTSNTRFNATLQDDWVNGFPIPGRKEPDPVEALLGDDDPVEDHDDDDDVTLVTLTDI